MKIGVLTLHLRLAGCDSLKAKRSRLKPLIARLQREFNVSVAEVGHQDAWQEAAIACALVSNAEGHTQRSLQAVVSWLERNWPDVDLVEDKIEVIQ
jgi:uncharacterized protein YlxP (DUF503 family)